MKYIIPFGLLKAECLGGEAQSLVHGPGPSPRASEMCCVILEAGRIPPWDGLAPCDSFNSGKRGEDGGSKGMENSSMNGYDVFVRNAESPLPLPPKKVILIALTDHLHIWPHGILLKHGLIELPRPVRPVTVPTSKVTCSYIPDDV